MGMKYIHLSSKTERERERERERESSINMLKLPGARGSCL
jgi:hypothetical protein